MAQLDLQSESPFMKTSKWKKIWKCKRHDGKYIKNIWLEYYFSFVDLSKQYSVGTLRGFYNNNRFRACLKNINTIFKRKCGIQISTRHLNFHLLFRSNIFAL